MVIGVTGGVGTGKSTVLSILKEDYGAKLILCDDVARELMEPFGKCYIPIVETFGEEILVDGYGSEINRPVLSEIVFNDPDKLALLNSLTHPVVKDEIREMIERYNEEGAKFIVVEAALLIEAGYLDIIDELWVVYTVYEQRVERLISSRNYSIERINDTMASQLSDEEFRKYADFVIDNSYTIEYTRKQIHERLDEGIYC